MIAELNRLVEFVEDHLTDDIDVSALATRLGTTEYHLRRMFSSLAGMPLSEYIRRRRMTVAAADVLGDERPAEHRGALRLWLDRGLRPSVPSRARRQPRRRAPGRRPPSHTTAAQVPPDRRREHHHGHPHRRSTGLPARRPRHPRAAHPPGHQPAYPGTHRVTAGSQHSRLKELSNTEPAGLLQVSADVDPDYTEGSELTYLHGVAVTDTTPTQTTSTRSRFLPARGRCSAPRVNIRRPCRRPGRRPPPTGSRPTRGGSGPGPRSSRFSTAPTTSARQPANCGSLSNAPDRAARGLRLSSVPKRDGGTDYGRTPEPTRPPRRSKRR